MAPAFYDYSRGLVDSDDPRKLRPGDLTTAVGVEYRLGTSDVFTTGPRSLAGTLGAGAHTGLVYAQYDTAASKLIAGVSTSLFEATAATSSMSGAIAVMIDSSYLISTVVESGGLTLVTTSVSHLFATGAVVRIQGVEGTIAPQANGTWTITVTGATTFTLDTSSSATLSGTAGTGLVFGPNPLVFGEAPTALVGRMQFERMYVAYGAAASASQGIVQRIASATVTRRQNLIRKSSGAATATSATSPPNAWLLQSMQAPTFDPVLTAQPLTATTVVPGTAADSGGWINANNARDGDDDTRARAPLSAPGTAIYTWSMGAVTASAHKLKILHQGQASANGVVIGVGGSSQNPFTASIKIEVSLNGNAGTPTWQTISNRAIFYEAEWLEYAIPNATYSSGDIKIRVTHTFTSGSVNTQAFIWTIKATNATSTFPLAPLGFRYMLTEWDDVNKYESGPGPESSPVTLDGSTQNAVSGTLPGRTLLQNNRSTHIRVYRQPEGAALGELDKYGLIAQLDITASSFVDTFDKPLTEVARPTLPVLITGQGADRSFYPNNLVVPLASSIDFYKGSMTLVPVDDANNVYYTPPYDVESRPSLYSIPSRSPRNDRPLAVRTCDNVWMIFFRNWTRRIEGIPLAINGLFDAANYGDASTTRGITGVLAIDNITNLEEGQEGGGGASTWLAVADDEGVYVTNGYTFKPWCENLAWRTRVELAHLTKTIIFAAAKRRRVEAYVVIAGASAIGGRYDFFYGQLREDGQPAATGPHPSVARGAVAATISGTEWRFTASNGVANAGGVYLEDPSAVFTDASQSVDVAGTVNRSWATGDLPIAGLGQDGYLRMTSLRTRRGAYASIAETVSMKFSSGEILTASNTCDPSAPTSCGVFAAGETLRHAGTDSGLTEKAELLGIYVESSAGGDEASALRAGQQTTAGTAALPT